jgi:hypothetical protein
MTNLTLHSPLSVKLAASDFVRSKRWTNPYHLLHDVYHSRVCGPMSMRCDFAIDIESVIVGCTENFSH